MDSEIRDQLYGAGRISRDQLYMGIAELLAQRSTCLRGHVGALVVVEHRIVSTGYNGAPSGQPDCTEVGCDELILYSLVPAAREDPVDRYIEAELGCQRAIHAELNAIVWAARHGIKVSGGHMYSTYAPCKNCAQAILAAGIAEFTYKKPYRLGRLDILEAAGIKIVQFP